MNTCPKCHGQLNGDFGMVVCPTCQAAVFFDMDGNPHVGDETPPVADLGSETLTQDTFENSLNDYSDSSSASEYQDLTLETSEPSTDYSVEVEYNFEQPIDHQQNLYSEPVPSVGLQKFEDITEFANSNLDTSSLLYDIRISGIDLADIRKDVFEELQDSRLALDLDQLKESIVDGVLVIQSIQPVKASVIIKRIRKLSVQLSWRQYAISQNS